MAFLPPFKGGLPMRAVIWIMLFTCTCFLYMIRVNLSIILLAMVEPTTTSSNITDQPECTINTESVTNMSSYNNTSHIPKEIPDYGVRFTWDKKLQGLILGAYFWGFTLTGIPGGALAERYGPSKCITTSFIVSGVLTLFGPWLASLHASLLIISRFLIGAFGGVVYPSLHCLVARWAPPDEKGKFVGALLGGALGSILTWPSLGIIIESIGWLWAFIICGIIVLCWTVMWFFIVTDSPEDHKRISEEERKYIMESLAGKISKNVKKLPPYRAMATSLRFWALIILHYGNLWGLFFLLTAGPNFMSSVLGFNLGHSGILAALPYLARLIFGIIFGQIGDMLIRKELMKKTTIRKSFVLFSHILPGVLLFSQTLTGCNVTWAIILITFSLGFNGASTITNLQNSQDLAPNFAGTLYGIINCVGSTSGFISPVIVGYLTSEKNGLEEWHMIFYIGSSVYICSAIVFCIFGSGETQEWNCVEAENKKVVDGIENIAFEFIESQNRSEDK